MKILSFNPGRIHASKRDAARGTLQLISARMCFLACGYLVSIILARSLGPIEYGVYGVILSVLVWLEQIGRFGVPEAVTKLIPEDEDRVLLLENAAQTLLLLVFLCLFAFSWLAAPALAQLFKIHEGASLFRLAIVDIPLSGLYFAYQGILTGRRRFNVTSGGLAVYGITKLVGILIALLLGLSLFSALIVNILGTAGALLFLVAHSSVRTFRPSLVQARSIIQLALPVGLLLLASQLLVNLDLWSLKIIGTEKGEVIGNYVAALNIARVPALVFSAINGVVLPSISFALAQKDMALTRRYVQGAGRFLWITLLPSCVLLALTTEDLMVLLYSDRYFLGALFLGLQVFGFAFFGATQVFSEMLIAAGHSYRATGAIALSIPVALVLNVALVTNFGAIGASAALALTGFFAAALTGIMVVRRLGPLMEPATFFKVMLAAALVTLVCTHVTATGFSLILKYLFLLALYVAVLFLLRELTWHDLQPFALWRRKQA